ncbi:MAG: ATP-binding protein [Vicinamibacterales bacterium]
MPARRFDRHSIRARVLLLQGAGWIVSLVLIGATGWLSLGELERRQAEAEQATARVVATAIDHLVSDDLAAIQLLSGAPDLGAIADREALRRAVRRVFQRTRVVSGLAVADDGGHVLASEPAAGHPIAPSASDVARALAAVRPVARVDGEDPRTRPVTLLVSLRDWHGELRYVAAATFARDARPAAELLHAAGAVLVEGPGRAGAAPLAILPWTVQLAPAAPAAASTPAAIRTLLLGLAPVLIVLGAIFAYGTAWSVRRPVLALTAAAERMTAGDLTTPLPELPDDEVGRLGAALEHLRGSLRQSLETIARHASELEQRVADRTRELEQMCHRLHDRDTWRSRLLRKVISAQEDERRRLARDLHDDQCQALAALGVSLDLAMADVPDGPARTRLASVKRLVDEGLADLHRVIYDLRPSVLDDLGLLPAIRWLAEQHLTRRGIAARCEFAGLEARRFAPEVETALFRVVQEAMVNIERHAEADTVLVQVALEDNLLSLEIEDDGRGFDPEGAPDPADGGRGLGLQGMRERVELLGGSCFVDSTPGRGTRVVVTVPAAQFDPEVRA